eukprot:3524966-Rhodomonas_salina.1
MLDYVLGWSRERIECDVAAFDSSHPSHDHRGLKARFPSTFLHRPTTPGEEVEREALNLGDCEWPMARAQWREEVAEEVAVIQELGLDPIDTMERSLKAAYKITYKLVGTKRGKRTAPAYSNKTTHTLLRHLGHLKHAKRELEAGLEGSWAQHWAALICTTPFKHWKDRQRMLRDICARSGRALDDELEEEDGAGNPGTADMPSPADRGQTVESVADWQMLTLANCTEQVGDMLRLLQLQYDKL